MNKYIWAVIESGSVVVFQFLSLIILSRLLTPADYGIFGAMALFISVGNLLADSGMGAALIKKENPTDIDYSTLFCFNLSVSILYYSLLLIFSSLISDFYNIESLSMCIKVYGVYVIIASLGLVQNVQLNREFRLKELTIITLTSSFLGLIIAILAGINGWGYWSLILQQIAFISSRVFFQFLYNRYMPKIDFSFDSFKEQFSYSVNLLAANILNTIYTNIVSIIIPKIGTLQQNGFYLQASKIQTVPMTITSSVMDRVFFPILCRLSEQDFYIIARKQINKISTITSMFIFICVLSAHPLINALLGPQWIPTANYLQILLLASFGVVFQYIIRSIFKAKSLTKKILKINFVQNILGISSILAASFWGVNVLLWGLVIVNLCVTAYYSFQVKQSLNYSLQHQLKDNSCMIILFVLSITLVLIK